MGMCGCERARCFRPCWSTPWWTSCGTYYSAEGYERGFDTCEDSALAHNAAERARRRRVELLLDAPGQIRLAPSAHRVAHRFSHQHGVLRPGNRRVHQHAIGA